MSPSQVRRFGLRTGDTVEGEIRSPKEGERYFALLKVNTINFEDPGKVRHRINFDNLTPLYPDERFSGTPPLPDGLPVAVAEKIFPLSARNQRREDVLERIIEIDRRYVEPPVDARFAGYADDHWIELDFGEQLRNHGCGHPSGCRAVRDRPVDHGHHAFGSAQAADLFLNRFIDEAHGDEMFGGPEELERSWREDQLGGVFRCDR